MPLSGDYSLWFQRITGFSPHAWQAELGDRAVCEHTLIRIPTGFGKTAGVVLAWLYHRVAQNNDAWPRRLVFTLPMRVLVEQTEALMRDWLHQAGLERDVAVHVLMGGVRTEPWVLYPDQPAILLGTQDMLLSRALNRGYGAARGRWPMDFALLHHDALWVLDEVQLMDVGLMTSAQLTAFRDHDAARASWFRPTKTWWMSATLQPSWLRSVDTAELIEPLTERITHIAASARRGGLWSVRKPAERRADVTTAEDIATLARERHAPGTLTLIIVNRVDQALATFDALVHAWSEGTGKRRLLRQDAPDLRLIHSRFRGHERRAWTAAFLTKNAPIPEHGRIIVSTQVIEAGVDISARLLLTELAPWSSLVQRAGRAARDAGDPPAPIVVVGAVPERDKDALPYDVMSLAAADRGWKRLMTEPPLGEPDASLSALTAFEDHLRLHDPEFLGALYPYQPSQVLQRSDLDDLFDTTADLTGADLDVSGFIRAGEERDVSVVWRPIDGRHRRISRDDIDAVTRDELCPVPVAEACKWLGDGHRAYTLDYIEGAWTRIDPDRLAPGTIVLVAAEGGGYDPQRGWDARSTTPVAPVSTSPTSANDPQPEDQIADRFWDTAAAQDDDSASIASFKTIATHGREAAEVTAELCRALHIPDPYASELGLAARWHDAGKAHPTFQHAIMPDARAQAAPFAERRDLAKAPDHAWRRPDPYPGRPGFRHELASTLALFELLYRTSPEHPALIGAYRDVLVAIGIEHTAPDPDERVLTEHPLAAELAALDASAFDRVAYLVCSHHGKVRCTWTSTPRDQEAGKNAICGVIDDDKLPSFAMHDSAGELAAVPELTLRLCPANMGLSARYGASWSERVANLRAHLGPFALAYLETILRAADARASKLPTEDPLR